MTFARLDPPRGPIQYELMPTIADFMQAEAHNEVTIASGEQLVLVVEPDEVVRLKVAEALDGKFKVLFALNGKHALDIMQKHVPQTIISETQLSILDGAGLLAAVKLNPTLERIPFIVLTENSAQDLRVSLLEKGANDYVLKPFLPQELQARISNLVKMRRYQQSLEDGLQAARIIQHALMPEAQVNLKNARFEFLYIPCDELSGDFLDLIQTEDSLYVYVADVTSHGTAAAQVTYLLKGLFREAIHASCASLSDTLRYVGRGFAALRLEHGVGLRAIKFNTATRELVIAGSNSPEPLIFQQNRLVLTSRGAGPIIDSELWVDEPFPMGTVSLNSGDFLYLFTDGCLEFPMPNGKQLGFMKFVSILRDADPRNWRTSVMDNLSAAQGSNKFPDDITIARLQIL